MSDSDGDFSDELLELAGAGEKRRKQTSSRSHAKRRKADVVANSDSEQEYESEEDDSNPYPLEGKFVDETDRVKLMQLPEIERENILAQRLEEMQRIQDKRNLDQMLRAQREDNVSKAAKRAHQVRGATKEKTRKLDELKAKRKAKSEKKRTRINSPKRERSSSPMDMEMSSEDEEDGQISKLEQQEERESRLLNKAKPEDDDLTLEDLEKCRLSRNKLVKYALMPWFEDFVKGSWVRYLIGADQGQPVYRICEIANLGANPAKPYKIENEYFDTSLELRHGAAIKVFPMDKVSNAAFTEDEWRRFKATCEHEKVKLPAKRTIEKKLQQFAKLTSHSLTEADVAAILARKAELNRSLPKSRTTATKAALERAELVRMRALAQMRRDFAESAALEVQLAALDARQGVGAPARSEKEDILAKVNERNRQANRDAVRRAEVAEAERRKKARLARAAAAANGSRAGTPGVLKDSPNGTPLLGASLALGDGARSVSPMPPQKGVLGKRAFESIVASSVEVDLGDF
ncbi:plus-3-domain-containing protein [Phellopilus nigrolimitatus]|nr:plus-3-domain-containing protein [Phellopilus nigrolimitatus]